MGGGNSTLTEQQEMGVYQHVRSVYESKYGSGEEMKEGSDAELQMLRELKAAYASSLTKATAGGSDGASVPRGAVHDEETLELHTGDVVKAALPGECLMFEGVIIGPDTEHPGSYVVDFGDAEHAVIHPSKMQRVLPWSAHEVGDTVQVKDADMPSMAFMGRITRINWDGTEMTYDIDFGDGEVEAAVDVSRMRKVASERLTPHELWHKAGRKVKAAVRLARGLNAFGGGAKPMGEGKE